MRKLSILLAAVMLFGILAACGNQAAEPTAIPSQSAEPTAQATAEPEPTAPQSAEPEASAGTSAQPEEIPSPEPVQTPELSAEPMVTTAYEMYMQHYDEAGNIIEIPQLSENSEAAKSINDELKAIGDEYYKEYIDGFVGNRTCEIIAYPCETEEFLCVILTVKELPDSKTDGRLYGWVYDRKNKAELAIDLSIDEEALKQSMKANMEYIGIEQICSRTTAGNKTEIYFNVKYSIDGVEYQGFYVKSDESFLQYLGGSLVPTYAVAVFNQPLWCQEQENNNQRYDTTETDETISALKNELKELTIAQYNLLLEPETLSVSFGGTVKLALDDEKEEKVLLFTAYEEKTNTVYGTYYYSLDSQCFYGADESGELAALK